jgi:hypothetical protein
VIAAGPVERLGGAVRTNGEIGLKVRTKPERQIVLDSKQRVARRIEPGNFHCVQHAVAVQLRKTLEECFERSLFAFHIHASCGGGVRDEAPELEFTGKLVNRGSKAHWLDGATSTDPEPQFGSPGIGR